MNDSVVIVGSGQAGVSVAFKLRALGYAGSITLVGEEPYLPYHRPPLSKKCLTNTGDADRIHIKGRDLYESERITLLLGCRVDAIDRREKAVVLESGDLLHYGRLVLATGARARRLPAAQGGGAHNVYTLRSLQDAMRLQGELVQGRKLLIVGGGYIGLETAAVARAQGMQVTLVEQNARILGRVASAETAAYFRSLHTENGVRILEGVALNQLACNNARATAAWLADGTVVETDAVIVGVGVIPETGLAERAALEINNGIIVDSNGRTADASVYAAGDCANFPYQGGSIRLESVQNAVDMADVIARSIVGQAAEYLPIPWFWSDQYATKLQIAGLNHGYTDVSVRRTSDSNLSIWYYAHQRLVAVDAINDARAFMTAKRWLGAGCSPAADEVADPSVALDAVSLSREAAHIN